MAQHPSSPEAHRPHQIVDKPQHGPQENGEKELGQLVRDTHPHQPNSRRSRPPPWLGPWSS